MVMQRVTYLPRAVTLTANLRQVLLRPNRIYLVAWAANIPLLCMRMERFVLLARRLSRYLSFAANGSGRTGGWGRLVGQMYRI